MRFVNCEEKEAIVAMQAGDAAQSEVLENKYKSRLKQTVLCMQKEEVHENKKKHKTACFTAAKARVDTCFLYLDIINDYRKITAQASHMSFL